LSRKLKPGYAPSTPKRQPPKWQRERNIGLLIWVIASLAILIVVGLVSYWAYDNYVAAWRQSVARVNEVSLNMDQYVKALRVYSQTITDPYQILQRMEDDEVLRQNAPALGVQVAAEEITRTVREWLTGSANSTMPEAEFQEQYQGFLEQLKLSDSEYRQLVEADLIRMGALEHFGDEVPDTARHVHLLVLERETREEATTALEQLNGGNVTVADELAEGDKGWIPPGLFPEYEAVFDLPAGNVTGPVATGDSYSVIKVSEIAEDMKVSDQHRDDLTLKGFETWLEEAQEASAIEEYLTQDMIAWARDHV
jgi:hypothetical protein